NEPAFIYRNNVSKDNQYLGIKLAGNAPNTQGIGARLECYSGDKVQLLEQNPARGYLSNVIYQLHFGLGKQTSVDSVVIRWNSGKRQVLRVVQANQVITLHEKDALDPQAVTATESHYFVKT